ncbi:transporter substrate-binding domain-containing protein [Amycolatopsis sp. NBC_01307]|uniref:caspase, EACC1-associated type n=1 Tax=Amycolatopsis sp. NBC_01307 TaxID=2903561 RepID=UPI002E11C52A|nr:transporter substrate-binding domain-containing protein [Amycolatopsis sp. NBC_01307]
MDSLADTGRSRAVIVGTGRYSALPHLPSVTRGAAQLATALTDPRLWGLPAAHCRVLTDPPSATTVLDAVRAAAAEATDLFVLHLAGHGFVDPDSDELHLALTGTDPDRPWTALPYRWLRHAMQHPTIRSRRKVVLLDCCYSGIALGGSLAGPAALGDRVAISGTCVLTATAETRTALAPRGEPFTAFTGALLRTLGTGVPDGPALLDVETIYHHLRAELDARNRPIPQLRSRNAGHRIVLVRNTATTAARPPAGAPAVPRRRWPAAVAAAAVLLTGADTLPPPTPDLPVNAVLACANPTPPPSPTAVDAETTPAITQARANRKTHDRIVIGIVSGRPGHTERCADGSLRGFDVAVGEIIAADLGYPPGRISWTELPVAARVSALQQHQVDFVAGSMAISTERKRHIAFAGPYEISAQTLLVLAGDTAINDPEDLRTSGKTLCGVAGSTGPEGVKPYLGDAGQIVTRTSVDECLRLLLRHQVEAVTGDRSLLVAYDKALAGRTRLLNTSFGDTAYGIAVAIGDPTLRQAIHDILAHSYRDGRYARAWKDSLGRLIPEIDSGPQLTE